MRNKLHDPKRRTVMITAVAAIASVPFAHSILSGVAEAADLPHLTEYDTAAKSLKYHHDASKAPRTDKAGVAAKDQFCHNCQFIQSSSGEWRPCLIFPGKTVNQNGWCLSWSKKM